MKRQSTTTASGSWIHRAFGVDLRSLAAMRIGLGLVVLYDLASRVPDLRAHYSDEGVLPREAIEAIFHPLVLISPHFHAMGSVALQSAVFAVSALFAMLMIVGYRTRFMTILTWFMLIGLHRVNEPVLGGGDGVLKMMLFWSIFVPTGARFSIDHAAARNPDRNVHHVSLAGGILLLQLALVYWVTGLMKVGPAWWEGWALQLALNNDQFVRPAGMWLRDFEGVTTALTYGTLALEFIGPFLIFLPFATGACRLIAIVSFMAFHLGILLCMDVGIFPYSSAAAWLVVIPTAFWDRLSTAARQRADDRVLYYDADCTFCTRAVRLLRECLCIQWVRMEPAAKDERAREIMQNKNAWLVRDREGKFHAGYDAWLELARASLIARPFLWLFSARPIRAVGESIYRWVANHRDALTRLTAFLKPREVGWHTPGVVSGIIAVLFIYVLSLNAAQLPYAGFANLHLTPLAPVGKLVLVDQRWSMFAPQPRGISCIYEFEATLADGRLVKLDVYGRPLRDGPTPTAAIDNVPNFRWRSYLLNLIADEPPQRARLPYLADYLRRRWNEHSSSQTLARLRIVAVVDPLRRGSRGPLTRVILWEGQL